MTKRQIKSRLEYLRGCLRAESISYGELHELQNLAPYIEPGDVELLEPAGVPESEAHKSAKERETSAEILAEMKIKCAYALTRAKAWKA